MKADLVDGRTSPGWTRYRLFGLGLLGAVIALTLLVALTVSPSRAALPPVNVFPVPGRRLASPDTQITLRGLPATRFGGVTVSGSKSGAHAGRILSDSDGDGGSFIPSKPFVPGERVTVSTGLNIVGGHAGSYSFTVATPAGRPGTGGLKPRGPEAWRCLSLRIAPGPGSARGDSHPPAQARRAGRPVPGRASQGPVQNGPMILGPYGDLIWFQPVPHGQSATDFRVQTLKGQTVLTWWQGQVSAAGTGIGVDEIYSTAYRPLATVRAGNGLSSDLHEFQLTPQGTALVTAYYPVYWTTGSGKQARRRIVLDSVVQEIDIPTGLVLYQWDSLDHVSTADSHQPAPTVNGHPWDYFHINSIQPESDGSLVVSSRDTWAVYDLSHQTGKIIWTPGRQALQLPHGTEHDVCLPARLPPSPRQPGHRVRRRRRAPGGPPPVPRADAAARLQAPEGQPQVARTSIGRPCWPSMRATFSV